MKVEFYDDRGNRLDTRDLDATPRVGEVFEIAVAREGLLRLVVTVVVQEGRVIVEPPSMAN